MKNKLQIQLWKQVHVASKMLLVMFTLLFMCVSSFAQNSPVEAAAKSDSREAIKPVDPSALLVKFQQDNPNDEYLTRAVHMKNVLDNPSEYTQYSAEHLENFKLKLEEFYADINQIHNYMQSGNTYDEAMQKFNENRSNSNIVNEK